MINCEVVEVLPYNTYVLKSKNNTYHQMLEFYEIDNPKVGDKIVLHEELLNVKSDVYTQPYAFLFDKDLKIEKIRESDFIDYAILKINDKDSLLKRVYG